MTNKEIQEAIDHEVTKILADEDINDLFFFKYVAVTGTVECVGCMSRVLGDRYGD